MLFLLWTLAPTAQQPCRCCSFAMVLLDELGCELDTQFTFRRCWYPLQRAKVVITATGVWRGPKTLGLKTIVDDALTITAKGGHTVGFEFQGVS